ncbi:hypothetical protein [Candidatus Protochlamydia amoebophila]|nr:hypothetical protein [Candidatus Protochlamydia amoebophila]
MATTQGSVLEKQKDAEFKQQFVSQQLQQITTVALGLKKTDNAATFYKSIVDAKNAGLEEDRQNGTFVTKDSKWFGAAIHTYSEEDYAQMRMFLISPDNEFGVAIKESGDNVSVFKHPATDKSIKAVDILLPKAIENGGTHLDCFNPILPILYAKHRMEPIAKVKFNEEFAPENWNFARDGTPDIIFMVYNKEANPPQDPTLLKELVQKQISELPYSSYEKAIEKQIFLLKSKK